MLLVKNAHLDQGKTFLFLRRCKILLFFSIGFLLFWVFLVIPFQKRKSIIISIEYGTFESINTPPVIATTTLEDVVASENAVSRGMNKNEIERSFSSSQERLSRYSLFHPNTHGAPESANAWYQNNVEPAITCSNSLPKEKNRRDKQYSPKRASHSSIKNNNRISGNRRRQKMIH